ncbi:uncharacterized protein LOC131313643 [Rhododendron vialii]|uniref:uncharacterized protein LOC131313643 n=1 Tax=Rhododendron vialii TaxID=182163 RepID=UPI00265FD141|nr:uncharacterized protein LOC131313643 [Rhododendron vialii]
MSAAKSSGKKRVSESEASKTEKQKRVAIEDDFDFDLDLSSDIKGIMSALKQIREKAHKDGQKKNEETISSVASEIKSMLDELKNKFEKERQSLAKALSKSSKEYETLLKTETDKFKAVYEKICKERAAHLQAFKDFISKHEEEKERLFIRYEQLRKKEKSLISEHEKACTNKIAELEESLKKKKQDDKTFSILRKTLGSFLENASDEDFPHDE